MSTTIFMHKNTFVLGILIKMLPKTPDSFSSAYCSYTDKVVVTFMRMKQDLQKLV